MKSIITHVGLFGIVTGLIASLTQSAAAQTPVFSRANVCGVPLGLGFDVFPRAIATDRQGNTFVAGSFYGTVRFGTTTLTGAGGDAFVAKRDANGVWLWAVSGGGAEADACAAIALDALGQVYVTGYFAAGLRNVPTTATFGSTTLTTAGGADVLVAKLDANTGAWLWAQRGGSGNANSGEDIGRFLATDGNGGLYVVGSYDGPRIVIGTTSIYKPGAFLARIDAATGAWTWAKSAGHGKVNALAADAQGNGYLGGTFGTLPPLQLTAPRTGYVVKFDRAGAWQWAATAGGNEGTGTYTGMDGTNGTECAGLAVDDQAHVYVCGYFDGTTATFGSTTLANASEAYRGPNVPGTMQMADAFVARLSAQTGAWQWATRAGGPDTEYLTHIAVRGNRIYTGGVFGRHPIQGPPSPGGSTFGTTTLVSTSKTDLLVAGLDTAGTWQWAAKAGSTEEDHMTGLVTDAGNRIHLTGIFEGTAARFGSLNVTAASRGYTGFLAQLASSPLASALPGATAAFSLYPNPARSAVTVTGLPANQALAVFDAVGRLVIRARMPASGPLFLQLPAQLPAGVYVVHSAGQVCRLLID